MKLTGRLLMAFGLVQLVAALLGLTVDESEIFYLQVSGRPILDLGPVFLIVAGLAVSKGSRKGLLIAALLSLFFTASAIYVLSMTAFSGIGQMSIWHLLVIFVLGIWSGMNLVLMIWLCDLKSSLPRYSLRTLLIIVLLVSIGLKGIRWLYEMGRPPPFASVSVIEQNYDRQIQRLLELAKNKKLLVGSTFNDPEDVAMFDAPEILEAKIESPRNCYCLFGSKRHSFISRSSTILRQPSIDNAVVNLHWDTQSRGNKLTVLEYHRLTRDDMGTEVGVILLFDLSVLEQKAVQPEPDNSPRIDATKTRR